MTPADIQKVIARMEQIKREILDSTSVTEARRLMNEHDQLFQSVAPFIADQKAA